MSGLEWELRGEQRAYSGWVKVARRTYRMPDGSTSEWDVIEGSRTVAIVARTEDGSFLISRQYRPGPGRVLDEIPGGFVRRDEEVEEAARRELLEETGFVPGRLTYLGSTWMTANAVVRRHVVLAEDCVRAGEPELGPDEFIEVVLMSPDEFVALVRSGELTDQDGGFRALDRLGLLA
jgi:ADP-ribose pyrophosphatase